MTDAWLDRIQDDVGLLAEIKDDKVLVLSELANELLKAQHIKDTYEEALEKLKKDIQILAEDKIPELMRDLGMRAFTLSNGAKVNITEFYSGQVIDDKGFDWLEEHNYADIAKSTLTILHRRSEDVAAIKHAAEALNLEYEETSKVHWKTMASFLKELTSKGEALPPEYFNVSMGQRASIKPPKKEIDNDT